ncbi:MAG: hypothetical protein ACREMS_12615 [Gemmatimonadaceae bacterium]
MLHLLFLATFIGGLVLGVFVMLHGVEHARTRRRRSRPPSPFLNLPAIAAFGVGFGAAGYPLASHSSMSAWGDFAIAGVSGVVAMSAMIVLLARWALRQGRPTSPADSDEIQGAFAVVTREIAAGRLGEISYDHLGERSQAPARGVRGQSIAMAAEVVIDRIENGVAFVEEWAVVEQRL